MTRKSLALAAVALVTVLAAPTSGARGLDPSADPSSQDPLREAILARVAPLQAELRARHNDSFGGMWIDESNVVTVAIAYGDLATEALVRDAGLPAGTVIRKVVYSEAELDAIHADIISAAGGEFAVDGVQLAGIESDVRNNRVNVFAVNAGSAARLAIGARFGPAVFVSSVPARSVGDCLNSSCKSPLKAGLKLYKNLALCCTSAFVMRGPGPVYYLTASGHSSNVGDTYQHPNGSNIGSVGLWNGWYNGSAADAAMIAIAASQKGNKLCKVLTSDMTCTVISITSREDYLLGQEMLGQSTCITRLQNTISCGQLQSTNNSVSVCRGNPPTDCRTISYLRRSLYTASPGDSGGAIFIVNEAIGVHTAPSPAGGYLYSHILNVEEEFGLNVQKTP